MIKFNIYSESINILHQIYDSLICFNSVKVSRLNINQNSISGKDKIHKILTKLGLTHLPRKKAPVIQ